MAASAEPVGPDLPFPIFRISHSIERYMLYDINVITWLRKTHHILGVLVGTLPQIPQQNVFLGLPLELMPEEARLLTEKGIAYVVVDSDWHRDGINASTYRHRQRYKEDIARDVREAARAAERKKLESTEKAMRRLRLDSPSTRNSTPEATGDAGPVATGEGSEALFSSESHNEIPSAALQHSNATDGTWGITPTTAFPLLPEPPADREISPPTVDPSAYALFKHLHDYDYFMSPGLRFGCQFTAYPGDPLRYHSHFLVVSAGWDEEIDLMDLVGGGRLGTGVKKGFLIGGVQPGRSASEDRTRTFCIEWGGM